MHCKFCHEPSDRKLCSRCADALRAYRNGLEDPRFDVAMSKKCKFVVNQVIHNQEHGGYVPPYSAFTGEEFDCLECGKSYRRVSKRSTSCAFCKKMADKFRMLKGQGATHRTSKTMTSYYNTYCRRQEEGKEVPRVFVNYMMSLNDPYAEYEEYKKTKQ
ncbi:hypothetical protein D3C79_696450 [compost metagenome]